MSCRGFAEGETPVGQNPTSATCLKMAGRLGEEETAERLGKPESGTVAGGVGPVGRARGAKSQREPDRATGKDVDSPSP